MSEEYYTAIGKIVVWIVTYIFIPLMVSVLTGKWVDSTHSTLPAKQKKKRF